MISAQYLPLKAVFYRFYGVICRHCASRLDLATRLQHVLLVFSRSKWSMKIQRGNQCIMLFKWDWCDLLLLDTKESANLQRADVAFSTLLNYYRQLFEIFRGYY